MQRDLVEDRGWVSQQEYRDGLALAQMMPGPLAAQLGMWLAYVRTGVKGATISSLAFVAPPFVLVVAIAWIYVASGGATWVGSVFYGVAPAAIAIIGLAAYRLLPLTIGRDALLWIAALVVGLITYFTRSEIALAFIAAGLVVVAITGRPGPAPTPRGAGPAEPAAAPRRHWLPDAAVSRLRRRTRASSARSSCSSSRPARSSSARGSRSCRSSTRASWSRTAG